MRQHAFARQRTNDKNNSGHPKFLSEEGYTINLLILLFNFIEIATGAVYSFRVPLAKWDELKPNIYTVTYFLFLSSSVISLIIKISAKIVALS